MQPLQPYQDQNSFETQGSHPIKKTQEQFDPSTSILLFFLKKRGTTINSLFAPIIGLVEKKEYQTAFDQLKNFINYDRNNAFAFALCGDILCCQKNFPEAECYLAQAANLDPKNDVIHLILATVILHAHADYNRAMQHLLLANQINPNNEYVYASLANILYIQEFFEDAKKYICKAIEINSQNSLAYTIYGSILYAEGNSHEAENYLRKAIELNPNDDSALATLGNLFIEKRNIFDAIKCVNEALRLNPNNQSALDAKEVIHSLQ